MIAKRLYFRQSHPDIDFSALHAQHNRLIQEMGLPFGLTHAEYKYHGGKFYLIEVAARGGGTNLSSHIVPLMSGVDSTGMLLKMALGLVPGEIRPAETAPHCMMEFFDFPPGRVQTVTGGQGVEESRGVVSLSLGFEAGDCLGAANDDSKRHGFLIAYAETESELLALIRKVKSQVQVKYAAGGDSEGCPDF
jgi:carbamoyl-phosphate synthase large subunit